MQWNQRPRSDLVNIVKVSSHNDKQMKKGKRLSLVLFFPSLYIFEEASWPPVFYGPRPPTAEDSKVRPKLGIGSSGHKHTLKAAATVRVFTHTPRNTEGQCCQRQGDEDQKYLSHAGK